MNITLITAEEQLHFENIIELQADTETDASVTIGRGENRSKVPLIPETTVIVLEKLTVELQKDIVEETPAPYVLLILDTLQEKKFYEAEEAYSRLNMENAEGRGHAFFEYNKLRNTYILLEYSANKA